MIWGCLRKAPPCTNGSSPELAQTKDLRKGTFPTSWNCSHLLINLHDHAYIVLANPSKVSWQTKSWGGDWAIHRQETESVIVWEGLPIFLRWCLKKKHEAFTFHQDLCSDSKQVRRRRRRRHKNSDDNGCFSYTIIQPSLSLTIHIIVIEVNHHFNYY